MRSKDIDPDMKKPFYAYGGVNSADSYWVFVIDHRNNYFAADRNPKGLNTPADESDDEAAIHIEGSFTKYENGYLSLSVGKEDTKNDVNKIAQEGLSLKAYENDASELYIFSSEDSPEFKEGFFLSRVRDCPDYRKSYNWIQSSLNSSDNSQNGYWGKALIDENIDPTLAAALENLSTDNSQEESNIRYFNYSYSMANIRNVSEIPQELNTLGLVFCMLGDLNFIQIDPATLAGGEPDIKYYSGALSSSLFINSNVNNSAFSITLMPVNEDLDFTSLSGQNANEDGVYKSYIGFELTSKDTEAAFGGLKKLEFTNNTDRNSKQAVIYSLENVESCGRKDEIESVVEFTEDKSGDGSVQGSVFYANNNSVDYSASDFIRGIYGLDTMNKVSFKTISVKADGSSIFYYWRENPCE